MYVGQFEGDEIPSELSGEGLMAVARGGGLFGLLFGIRNNHGWLDRRRFFNSCERHAPRLSVYAR